MLFSCSLSEISEQIGIAIAWVYKTVERYSVVL